MGVQRYVIDGFGQLELNQVAFPRDGRIEAQCALDATDLLQFRLRMECFWLLIE